ncbi:AraC family ligand binding domain-containing protein [uncultured Microbacterium sp.]|uniref:AraC family ligand binding domain-containing protein n=1 Tax=uncultured Microbacterium sp. TaxID=191216 RepID=UPI002618F52C|nr:AraC family ligand binding domain-containing protein [uncultured Microbacterium sp.]
MPAPSPRLVGDAAVRAEIAGAVWSLQPAERGLDANIIDLPAGDEIARHDGPALDVLILVLDGGGVLETAGEPIDLTPGALAWLPPHSQRRFIAGASGLRYFSVHARKPGLAIGAAPARDA